MPLLLCGSKVQVKKISQHESIMTEPIILTTGIYDMVKELLRKKRVTPVEEELLQNELKTAIQVTRKELPDDIVNVNRKVTIRDHASQTENEYLFVGTTKSKPSKGKFSIASAIALATVGRKTGDVIEWPFKEGTRKIEIVKVEVV